MQQSIRQALISPVLALPESMRGGASLSSLDVEERASNTQQAYNEIRRRILENEMPPNAQYLEQELAEMLGMSRTPVREALIRLHSERLVEVRPRHGARVLPVLASDVREIYDLMSPMAALATQQVAKQGVTVEFVTALRREMSSMEIATATREFSQWSEHCRRFYIHIVVATNNRRLLELFRVLLDQSFRACEMVVPDVETLEQANAAHAAVVKALQRQDAENASRVVSELVLQKGRRIADYLERDDAAKSEPSDPQVKSPHI